MPEVQWPYLLYDAIFAMVFFFVAVVLTYFLKSSSGYKTYIATAGIVKGLLQEHPMGSWTAGLEPG